jgi:hypothetical protein
MDQHGVKRAAKVIAWVQSGYSMPAPSLVKWSVLARYGDPSGVWVETGTYFGDTTAYLARTARKVVTIEPDQQLAERAAARFANQSNVVVLHGTSEEVLPGLLRDLDGPVSFWLDGHFSGGVTFQGPVDTPIGAELAEIERYLEGVSSANILVDDFRCFDPENPDYRAYPPKQWLVDWAVRNGLRWTVEQDIFIAQRVSP